MNQERYNSCIKDCELTRVTTNKINAEVFKRIEPSKKSNVNISFKPRATYVDDSTIESTINAEIEGFPRANAKNPSWRIDVKVSANFSVPCESERCLSETELNTFATRQGLVTLLPYLRSVVSHISSECGLGAITLPLVKFPMINTEQEASGKKAQTKKS